MTECVGIVGLGLLGRGIAACFLQHGFRVVAIDHTDEQHAQARSEIARMLGSLPTERYIAATDFASLAGCTFVVESVTENEKVKEEVLRAIEAVVGVTAVIASNTSAIPISRLQAHLAHPARFLGMHWAEPAHLTRFMELIRGARTSPETLAATEMLARRLGKDPCICRQDVPGFIVNRIGYAMYCEALSMLDSGVADAETIDRAMRNAFGLWATVCGPFRWMDISGGPELYARAMKPVLPTLAVASGMTERINQLANSGARGILNGHGFFNYTPEEARHWEELYRRHAARVAQMQNEYFPLPDEIHSMNERELKLEALGYPLSRRTTEGSLVDALAVIDHTLYASGQVPFDGDLLISKGKVPSQVSVEDAVRAAALCAANVLRAVHAKIGSLDRIERVVRLTGYVNADTDFTDCHLVINGASQLVRDVFGDAGRHARTALAMAQLPLGASVEVEMILQLKD